MQNVKTNFLPSLHGFGFVNSFSGLPLPFSTSALPGISTILSRSKSCYGLCGGMSSAAWDFFIAGRTIPSIITVPETGSPLHRYLYQRQIDTYGFLGKSIGKFAKWMALSDSKVQKRTDDELQQICDRLDNYQAVILGIVYVSLVDTLAIWLNHQVLAYGYAEKSPKTLNINIYDPNFPGRDDVIIEIKREFPSFQCTQKLSGADYKNARGLIVIPSGAVYRNIRGFFAMPYIPVNPPTEL